MRAGFVGLYDPTHVGQRAENRCFPYNVALGQEAIEQNGGFGRDRGDRAQAGWQERAVAPAKRLAAKVSLQSDRAR